MDRQSALQKRLSETEKQIANGELQIAHQRKLIAELGPRGRNAAHARYLLAGLELLQSARRDSREWLLEQLKAYHEGVSFPTALVGRCQQVAQQPRRLCCLVYVAMVSFGDEILYRLRL